MSDTATDMFKPNTLVAYHGGGYDGCIYEWNYAYFDADGEFHDIFSSGALGCPTEKKLRERYEHLGRSKHDVIDLTDTTSQEALNKFADTEGLAGVVGCAQFFADNGIDVKIRPMCNSCGERFNPVKGKGTDYRGCGGIEYHATNIICEDCAEEQDSDNGDD